MSGYHAAIELAESKLKSLEPQTVVKRARVEYDGGEYYVPWFGVPVKISEGKETERILWLHYLISEGTREPSQNDLISYREIPGAKFYEPKFIERAVNPLAKRFGKDPAALLSAGLKLNGVKADAGDYSVTLFPFPLIPVTYIIWEGDEEFPASANILFDRTAAGRLDAEDAAVLASVGTYKLIKF